MRDHTGVTIVELETKPVYADGINRAVSQSGGGYYVYVLESPPIWVATSEEAHELKHYYENIL